MLFLKFNGIFKCPIEQKRPGSFIISNLHKNKMGYLIKIVGL